MVANFFGWRLKIERCGGRSKNGKENKSGFLEGWAADLLSIPYSYISPMGFSVRTSVAFFHRAICPAWSGWLLGSTGLEVESAPAPGAPAMAPGSETVVLEEVATLR